MGPAPTVVEGAERSVVAGTVGLWGCPVTQISCSLFPELLVFSSSSHKDQMPTQAGMGQLQWQRPLLLPLLPQLISCGHVSSLPPPRIQALCPSTPSFPSSFLSTPSSLCPQPLRKNAPQRKSSVEIQNFTNAREWSLGASLTNVWRLQSTCKLPKGRSTPYILSSSVLGSNKPSPDESYHQALAHAVPSCPLRTLTFAQCTTLKLAN